MKKLNFKKMLNFRSFALAGIFAVALFAVSCNKENDDYIPEVSVEEDAALKAGKAIKKSDMTIADIVVASTEAAEPQFTLLYAALEYAGLTDVFAGGDQYTVFAPTDQAFINLVVALGVDPNDPFTAIDAALGAGTVKNVLLYHVTDGRRGANSVVPPKNPRTIETLLEGATFNVDADGKIWAVGNTANFVVVDGEPLVNISASNGIIHVIDTVILPID